MRRVRAGLVLAAALLAAGCSANGSGSPGRTTVKVTGTHGKQQGNQLVLHGQQVAADGTTKPAPGTTTTGGSGGGTGQTMLLKPAVPQVTPTSGSTPKLLSDGTIDAGPDPFRGIERPPGESMPLRTVDPYPDIAVPDHHILDDVDVRAARLGTVKIMHWGCGGIVAGSGWVASATASTVTIVTNAHVVGGLDGRAWVQPGGVGRRFPAQVTYVNGLDDVAVLRVPGLTSSDVSALPLGTASVGMSVALEGYPLSGDFHLDAGRLGATVRESPTQDGYGVTAAGPKTIQLVRGMAEHGNSGSPYVDATGAVVAMVSAIDQSHYGDDRIAVAVPLAPIRSALASAGTTDVDSGPCTAT